MECGDGEEVSEFDFFFLGEREGVIGGCWLLVVVLAVGSF